MYYHLEKEILNLPLKEQLELLEKIIHNLNSVGISFPSNKMNTEKKINLRTYPVGLSNPDSTFRRTDMYGDYGR